MSQTKLLYIIVLHINRQCCEAQTLNELSSKFTSRVAIKGLFEVGCGLRIQPANAFSGDVKECEFVAQLVNVATSTIDKVTTEIDELRSIVGHVKNKFKSVVKQRRMAETAEFDKLTFASACDVLARGKNQPAGGPAATTPSGGDTPPTSGVSAAVAAAAASVAVAQTPADEGELRGADHYSMSHRPPIGRAAAPKVTLGSPGSRTSSGIGEA